MRILTSNDDGVHANGNVFLRETLAQKNKVLTVAPNQERSSCGHGITLGDPVRIHKLEDNVYSCTGYPADCVLVAVGHFYQEQKPDLVVSGINIGANLGQDRYYSGTIAAAREGAFRGIPAIAISLVLHRPKDMQHFETAANYVSELIEKRITELIPPMTLLNINVPNLPPEEIKGVELTSTGYQKYSEEIIKRSDGRGKSYFWVGGTYQGYEDIPGSDCNAVYEGKIAVTLQDLSGRDELNSEAREKIKSLL